MVQTDMLSHLLFALSVLPLPKPFASIVALGIRSQGAGICFLTRDQWAAVVYQAGYHIEGREELIERVSLVRKCAGFKASGNLFMLLTPRKG